MRVENLLHSSTQRQKGSNGINGAAVTATHTTKAGRVATKKY